MTTVSDFGTLEIKRLRIDEEIAATRYGTEIMDKDLVFKVGDIANPHQSIRFSVHDGNAYKEAFFVDSGGFVVSSLKLSGPGADVVAEDELVRLGQMRLRHFEEHANDRAGEIAFALNIGDTDRHVVDVMTLTPEEMRVDTRATIQGETSCSSIVCTTFGASGNVLRNTVASFTHPLATGRVCIAKNEHGSLQLSGLVRSDLVEAACVSVHRLEAASVQGSVCSVSHIHTGLWRLEEERTRSSSDLVIKGPGRVEMDEVHIARSLGVAAVTASVIEAEVLSVASVDVAHVLRAPAVCAGRVVVAHRLETPSGGALEVGASGLRFTDREASEHACCASSMTVHDAELVFQVNTRTVLMLSEHAMETRGAGLACLGGTLSVARVTAADAVSTQTLWADRVCAESVSATGRVEADTVHAALLSASVALAAPSAVIGPCSMAADRFEIVVQQNTLAFDHESLSTTRSIRTSADITTAALSASSLHARNVLAVSVNASSVLCDDLGASRIHTDSVESTLSFLQTAHTDRLHISSSSLTVLTDGCLHVSSAIHAPGAVLSDELVLASGLAFVSPDARVRVSAMATTSGNGAGLCVSGSVAMDSVSCAGSVACMDVRATGTVRATGLAGARLAIGNALAVAGPAVAIGWGAELGDGGTGGSSEGPSAGTGAGGATLSVRAWRGHASVVAFEQHGALLHVSSAPAPRSVQHTDAGTHLPTTDIQCSRPLRLVCDHVATEHVRCRLLDAREAVRTARIDPPSGELQVPGSISTSGALTADRLLARTAVTQTMHADEAHVLALTATRLCAPLLATDGASIGLHARGCDIRADDMHCALRSACSDSCLFSMGTDGGTPLTVRVSSLGSATIGGVRDVVMSTGLSVNALVTPMLRTDRLCAIPGSSGGADGGEAGTLHVLSHVRAAESMSVAGSVACSESIITPRLLAGATTYDRDGIWSPHGQVAVYAASLVCSGCDTSTESDGASISRGSRTGGRLAYFRATPTHVWIGPPASRSTDLRHQCGRTAARLCVHASASQPALHVSADDAIECVLRTAGGAQQKKVLRFVDGFSAVPNEWVVGVANRPGARAEHAFGFYHNDLPYLTLDAFDQTVRCEQRVFAPQLSVHVVRTSVVEVGEECRMRTAWDDPTVLSLDCAALDVAGVLSVASGGVAIGPVLTLRGGLHMSNRAITDVADPVHAGDVANRAYVDRAFSGVFASQNVFAAPVFFTTSDRPDLKRFSMAVVVNQPAGQDGTDGGETTGDGDDQAALEIVVGTRTDHSLRFVSGRDGAVDGADGGQGGESDGAVPRTVLLELLASNVAVVHSPMELMDELRLPHHALVSSSSALSILGTAGVHFHQRVGIGTTEPSHALHVLSSERDDDCATFESHNLRSRINIVAYPSASGATATGGIDDGQAMTSYRAAADAGRVFSAGYNAAADAYVVASSIDLAQNTHLVIARSSGLIQAAGSLALTQRGAELKIVEIGETTFLANKSTVQCQNFAIKYGHFSVDHSIGGKQMLSLTGGGAIVSGSLSVAAVGIAVGNHVRLSETAVGALGVSVAVECPSVETHTLSVISRQGFNAYEDPGGTVRFAGHGDGCLLDFDKTRGTLDFSFATASTTIGRGALFTADNPVLSVRRGAVTVDTSAAEARAKLTVSSEDGAQLSLINPSNVDAAADFSVDDSGGLRIACTKQSCRFDGDVHAEGAVAASVVYIGSGRQWRMAVDEQDGSLVLQSRSAADGEYHTKQVFVA